MGRHANPTKLAIMNGTFRLDRNKITPDAKGVPVKPAGLGRYGSPLWDAVVEHATSIGAGACDSETLAGMCRWYDDYRRTRGALAKLPVNSRDFRATMYAAATAWRAFHDMASRFGLTPVDRAKLKFEVKDVAGGEQESRFFG